MLQGRILLNLDSEEEGTLYIGCAGGQDTELVCNIDTEPAPTGYRAACIRVGGLQGGHSGVEIDRGRGNAIKLLSRFLAKQAPLLEIRLAHIDGGSKRNAIPRECDAVVFVPPANCETLRQAACEFEQACREEYRVQDPGVYVRVAEQGFQQAEQVFRTEFQDRLLNLLCCLPHGVLSMNHEMPGLVQTSTNLAAVKAKPKGLVISTSQRSSMITEREAASDMVASAGRLAGLRVRHGGGYPGWKPNPRSPVLGLAQAVYPSLFGKEPKVTGIRAGLECGIIGDRFPGMDMLSFGPTIAGAHSPDERVDVPAVKRFWDLLVAMLERIEEAPSL
jgi:dipeptidase D